MKITYACRSQQGLRTENQDRFGVVLDSQRACFVVCDGVAGLPGGERAAQLVSDMLLENVRQLPQLTWENSQAAVADCQALLQEAQSEHPAFSQMSTTLAALFINRQQQQVWWAHAGDSRIYHFRRGTLSRITRDHSLAQQLKDAGYAVDAINQHLLYNALGTDPLRPATFSDALMLEDGDAFLLCSDGFWLNLTTEEMQQALRMVNSCEEWLALMEVAASKSAQKDNLSAISVWIGEPQDATLFYSAADLTRFLPSRF